MRRVGKGGIVPASERPLMTQAIWRLLLICVAAAAGETIGYLLGAYDILMWFALFFGAGAYIITQGFDAPRPPRGRRGEVKYWRGRPVDDDDPPQRLN